MIKVQKNGICVLEASDGMFLTQKAEVLPEHESRLYVKQITVDATTENNYREATAEEKEAYENMALNEFTPIEEEPMQKSMAMPNMKRSIEAQRISNATMVGELKNELKQTEKKIEEQENKYKKLLTALVIGVGIIIVGMVITIVII